MILAVVGPTGVGKTKLSIALAKKYHAIILNCDAMQVYQGLNIGTAKIKEEEKEGIPHFLFDFVDVKENYTVYHYQKDARKIIKDHPNQNIILVGGTGLYLKALLYDYQFSKEEKEENFEDYSNEELYELCLKKDSQMLIHPHNRRRMIRFLTRKDEPVDAKPLYSFLAIGLTMDRKNLYELIDHRVDQMIHDGLIDEAKAFYDQNIRSKALETAIGYKELYDYFDGVCTKEEAICQIKKNSRHYAKRQYTFFRHQLPVQWFQVSLTDFSKTIEEVEDWISKQKMP